MYGWLQRIRHNTIDQRSFNRHILTSNSGDVCKSEPVRARHFVMTSMTMIYLEHVTYKHMPTKRHENI